MIKYARIKKRLTQSVLAKKVGVSQPYISKLETRSGEMDSGVSFKVIWKISKSLDVCPYLIVNHMYNLCDGCTLLDCPNCKET